MYRLENWSCVIPDPYKAPEMQSLSLHGKVYGHPRFEDGKTVTTSIVVGINDNNYVMTYSGSSYELGEVDPDYEQKFPDSRERLFDRLRKNKTPDQDQTMIN